MVAEESLVLSRELSPFLEKDELKCSTVDRVPEVEIPSQGQDCLTWNAWKLPLQRVVWRPGSILLGHNSIRFAYDEEPLDCSVTGERELGDNLGKTPTRPEPGQWY